MHLAILTIFIACNFRVSAQNFSAEELTRRTMERRTFEAVIWGMPAVNYELMCQAVFRAKGEFNHVIYWSRLPDWKNQSLTPNPDVIYLMPFYNTKDVGPMVLEIPPAGEGSITGSVDDAWQTALEDVGPAGVDKGNGGKYLILPPGYKKKIPKGYIAMPSQTFAGFALLRSNLRSGSEADVAKALAYGKRIKFYPLSQAANPSPTIFDDVADFIFDCTITYDGRFFLMLDRFIQREPFLTRDKAMIDMLKSIGIEKGQTFNPDSTLQKIIASVTQEARQWLDARFEETFKTPYNPGRHWAFPASPDFAEAIQNDYTDPNTYPVDGRAAVYSMAFFSAKHLGEGQFYLMAITDKDGKPLDGNATYGLTVPSHAPVRLYWSVTLYDRATHALIRDQKWSSRSSTTPGLKKNKDNSVNVYFGPTAPAGNDTNWIPTSPGGTFEALFRFYGPEKALFEKRWKLPDIVPLK